MKKYMLIVFSVIDNRELYAKVESLAVQRFNKMKIGTFNLLSFYSSFTLGEIKAQLDGVYVKTPLFILMDASTRGDNFDLSFGKLEETILLENIEEEKEAIALKDLTLNDLLDMVTSKGYNSLTPEQKELLNKFSNEDES